MICCSFMQFKVQLADQKNFVFQLGSIKRLQVFKSTKAGIQMSKRQLELDQQVRIRS